MYLPDYGAVDLRRNGIGAELRVAGNADRIPTQALDPVVAAFGFHVDQGTLRQVLAIDHFRGRHR